MSAILFTCSAVCKLFDLNAYARRRKLEQVDYFFAVRIQRQQPSIDELLFAISLDADVFEGNAAAQNAGFVDAVAGFNLENKR